MKTSKCKELSVLVYVSAVLLLRCLCWFFVDCKGMMLAKDIRDRERGGRAEIGVIEGDAEAKSPHLMDIMTSILGERPSVLPSGTPDEISDQEQMTKLTLYQYILSHLHAIWPLKYHLAHGG